VGTEGEPPPEGRRRARLPGVGRIGDTAGTVGRAVEGAVDTAVGQVERRVVQAAARAVGETRFPVTLAILAALGCQLLLPSDIRIIKTRWLLPALEVAVLIPLVVANPIRLNRESRPLRLLSLTLLLLIAGNDAYGIARLVHALLYGDPTITNNLQGTDLIRAAAAIWITNVIVFALAYFELDQGGPFARLRGDCERPDFLFPQQTGDTGDTWPDWRPMFTDYLFLSFTNSTAFSPTDTMPLSARAKMLMLVQAGTSFVTIGVVAARAVNILNQTTTPPTPAK
jgi:hypothetical protein